MRELTWILAAASIWGCLVAAVPAGEKDSAVKEYRAPGWKAR